MAELGKRELEDLEGIENPASKRQELDTGTALLSVICTLDESHGLACMHGSFCYMCCLEPVISQKRKV